MGDDNLFMVCWISVELSNYWDGLIIRNLWNKDDLFMGCGLEKFDGKSLS